MNDTEEKLMTQTAASATVGTSATVATSVAVETSVTVENGSAQRTVARVLHGHPTSDGAGVKLTRLIGTTGFAQLDPFLLLDEFGSEEANDYIAGFPNHPHRGFETVTYMLEGRMRHGDNQGNTGLLGPGSIQWMTAGRGIIHSEMPEQDHGRMRGFQLWVNLPASEKMKAPAYQDIAPERVPVVREENGGEVRVLAGEYRGHIGPARAQSTAPLYLDVRLPTNASVSVPVTAGHNAFVYVFEGKAHIGAGTDARALSRGDLGVLTDGSALTIGTMEEGTSVIVVAGRPIGEPVVKYGPFVMNTREEIIAAVEDFNAGRF